MKLAFFDAQSYDMPGFDRYSKDTDWEIKYFETRLNEDTVSLCAGYDAVCVFVNDTVNSVVVNRLYELGEVEFMAPVLSCIIYSLPFRWVLSDICLIFH